MHYLGEISGLAPRMTHDFLGRCYSRESVEDSLHEFQGVRSEQLKDPARTAAELLEAGEIIGWFEGGSEFGPRALGHRSILADPRNPRHKRRLNKDIKKREEFRPFAPSILEEEFSKWFLSDSNSTSCSSFMLLVDSFLGHCRNLVPAVCHVDGSGRLQTVAKHHNSRFRCLIEKFHDLAGIPLVLNTSFNAQGEPIVETPSDAIRSAKKMQLRYCIIEDMLITLNS
jgi:carbamoyltransferase